MLEKYRSLLLNFSQNKGRQQISSATGPARLVNFNLANLSQNVFQRLCRLVQTFPFHFID